MSDKPVQYEIEILKGTNAIGHFIDYGIRIVEVSPDDPPPDLAFPSTRKLHADGIVGFSSPNVANAALWLIYSDHGWAKWATAWIAFSKIDDKIIQAMQQAANTTAAQLWHAANPTPEDIRYLTEIYCIEVLEDSWRKTNNNCDR
jgi:hypothetical protein